MRETKRNKTTTKTKTQVLKNNFYILKLAWGICPGRVVADFLFCAIDYFSWVFFSVILIKYIVSSLEVHRSFPALVLFVSITLVIYFCIDLYTNWYQNKYRPITDNILYEKLNELLIDKATEVELACYENTKFYNSYTLALKEADTRVSSVLDNMAAILFAVIASIVVLIFMYQTDKTVILFVLFPFIGNFIFGKLENELIYNRDKESVPHQRKMDYVNRTVYLQNYAKEIRLSNIYKVLLRTYEAGFHGVYGVINKYALKGVTINSVRGTFNFLLIYVGVLLYGAYQAIITKNITISDFAILAGAMQSASWMLIGLCENVVKTFQNSLYIKNLITFLQYESKIPEHQEGIIPDNLIHSIEFRNVSFTYMGQNEPIIKNMSFKVEGNKKIAIVGHNGAGKTTLVKLLMRLYDPDQGEILVNGINVKEYHVKKYRKLFGTAFQDYQIFSLTIAENVLMRSLEGSEDLQKVEEALQKSGAYERVMSLKNRMDTVLTREFDDEGEILSGGELQKIALARVFAKDYKIAIFDEPSSALDPIAEAMMFDSMMEACKDKIVFFISHRLSSVIHADWIYMCEDGSIIEEGAHNELIHRDGKYADMFRKQAERYLEEYIQA